MEGAQGCKYPAFQLPRNCCFAATSSYYSKYFFMRSKKAKTRTDEQAILNKAVDSLISGFKTPQKLLSFIVEAQSWVHGYQSQRKNRKRIDDSHFDLYLYSRHIIPTWLAGGNDLKKKLAGKMEKELANWINGGWSTARILRAYAWDINQGLPGNSALAEDLSNIQKLHRVNCLIGDFVEARQALRKENNKEKVTVKAPYFEQLRPLPFAETLEEEV